MKLEQLSASGYRSLRDLRVPFGSLNVFIGANASGKSNILDALRFLSEAVREKDFAGPVRDRGGPLALAWKGAPATKIRLVTTYMTEGRRYEWTVELDPLGGFDYSLDESVTESQEGGGPGQLLLQATRGKGRWWSPEVNAYVPLAQSGSACALAAASVDASFRAGSVAQFVGGWAFFDPSPPNLRRVPQPGEDDTRLDPFGRNLALRLRALKRASPAALDAILAAMRSVLGVPEDIELRESEDGQRVYFVQTEAGLRYPVHQLGASSGTLRMLALTTGLLGESQAGLVGIEEPENHVHPAAIESFVEHIKTASERIQIALTTHSPLLLDCIDDPGAIIVVRRTAEGTTVVREQDPLAIRRALRESGFALGEFHQTKGFGA